MYTHGNFLLPFPPHTSCQMLVSQFVVWWGYSPKICLHQVVLFSTRWGGHGAPNCDYPQPCILDSVTSDWCCVSCDCWVEEGGWWGVGWLCSGSWRLTNNWWVPDTVHLLLWVTWHTSWVEAGCPVVLDVPCHSGASGGCHLTGKACCDHCCPFTSPATLHEIPSLYIGSELGRLGQAAVRCGRVQVAPYLSTYSDSKNWFIQGHFFLCRQVVPQRTKLNPYEIMGTKYSILDLCVSSIGHLALVIELIWALQWVTLDESVIVQTQNSPRSCGNHMTKPWILCDMTFYSV